MTAPFLGSDSGITRGRLRGPGYEHLSRNLYRLVGAELTLPERVRAAQLVFPDGIACHRTGALLLGLPVDDDGVVHLARRAKASRSERTDWLIHRLPLAAHEIATVGGIRTTTSIRTFLDLSATLSLEELVAVGDVVLRRTSRKALEKAVGRASGRRGVVLARTALPLLDAGSDSPAETRARLRLHAAGFTRMRHRVDVRDEGGQWVSRPDLADELAKVAVQHEGLAHFERGAKQRRQDVDRDELTREQGWEVVISTAIDDARPGQLVRKVTAAYLRQAQRMGPRILPPHLARYGSWR